MRVKANELRLGNYVDYYCEVLDRWTNSKVIDYIDRGTDTDTSYYIEGIPLTEEWLLKFGSIERKGLHPWYSLKINTLEFQYDNTDPINIQLVIGDYVISIPCKYVHQLQNIYFALTGEELTIKNETK